MSFTSNGSVKMKTPERKQIFKPTVLALAMMGINLPVQSATVPISNLPLTGVDVQYSPNITLTPSVEHPTAGAAYSSNDFMWAGYPTLRVGTGEARWENHWKTYYLGYFDNTKCYKFSDPHNFNGHFYVSSKATTDAQGRVGLCSGNDEEYSGNFLNWATMSAIDIFRHTLTGGNRAYGTGNSPSNYQVGDTPSNTFLRRAFVHPTGQNGLDQYRLRLRAIDLGGYAKPADFAFLKRIIPGSMVDSFLIPTDAPGWGYPLGFQYLTGSNSGQPVSPTAQARWANKIFFYNKGFSVQAVIYGSDGTLWFQNRGGISDTKTQNSQIKAKVRKAMDIIRGTPNMNYGAMPVVIKACDEQFGISDMPKNCRKYNNSYKPEGLMQQYGRGNGPDSRPARFAVFGYQLADSNDVSGGVLRARMKYLDRTQQEGSVVYGQEWDPNSGVLAVNPDTYDANQTGVTSSGAINYINRFGDIGRYKGYDTAAELFYTAQRYLRNKGMPSYYEQTQRAAGINPTTADGFPMIYKWDDPLTRGLSSPTEAQCRSNTMILIGDTFTHDEKDLPNFVPTSGVKDDNEIQTADILKKILDQEKFKGLGADSWNLSRGSRPKGREKDYSPAGIVALAYWGRTNDIRQDIKGTQNINTFMIDVLENGQGRFEADNANSLGNAYYWAAKYGGFDYAPGSVEWPNQSRDSWTKDAPSSSSSPTLFPDGIPNNFALGNSPENMVKALNKAFVSATSYKDPSQSAIAINDYEDSVVDVATGSTMAVQAIFKVKDLSGNLIGKRLGLSGGKLTFIPEWRAADLLNNLYHNNTGTWINRKVFTKAQSGSTVQFTPSNLSAFESTLKEQDSSLNAASLTKYLLGDSTQEGSAWRKRSSLMGTIINSTPSAILKPKQVPNGCTYSDSTVMNRSAYYAVAANDGMLHILDHNGVEKMGYIPKSALPKLYNFAKLGAIHEYINDGSPVTAEVCFGSEAKSLLIGTTGRGGSSIYALDVTNLNNPSASNILWDFSNKDDSDLGLTVGQPAITKNGSGNPLVILSSGYNNTSGKGYLYILNAQNTGSWIQNSNYWKIPLGSSGVGEPFVYDDNRDGIPEAVFVGDNEGKVWRINYDQASNTWSNPYGTSPLYSPSSSNSPITGAPFAQKVGGRLYVVVGTGQYFSLSDIASNVQNYALGLFADMGPITEADLLQQYVNSTGTEVNAIVSTTEKALEQKLYTITTNPLTAANKGWRLKLLPGQSIVSASNIHRSRVATFTAVRSIASLESNACGFNGATARIAVDLKTGGQFNGKVFDTNNDGNFDENDKLGGMIEASNILAPKDKTVDMMIDGKRATVTSASGDIGLFHMTMNPFRLNSVRRISWREIF